MDDTPRVFRSKPDDRHMVEARAQITSAVKTLDRTLGALEDSLRADRGYPAISAYSPAARIPAIDGCARKRGPVDRHDDLEDERAHLIRSLVSIDYAPGQGSADTTSCPGVIGASRSTIRLAEAVNSAKADFKRVVTSLGHHTVNIRRADKPNSKPTRVWISRYLLELANRGTVAYQQAYRQIVIAECELADAQFFWTQSTRGQTMTLDGVRAYLVKQLANAKASHDEIEADFARLNALPCDEKLSWQKKPQWSLRASLTCDTTREVIRSAALAAVPILYLAVPGGPIPSVTNPGTLTDAKKRETNRGRRKSGSIEPIPYLTSVPVHRFRRE